MMTKTITRDESAIGSIWRLYYEWQNATMNGLADLGNGILYEIKDELIALNSSMNESEIKEFCKIFFNEIIPSAKMENR